MSQIHLTSLCSSIISIVLGMRRKTGIDIQILTEWEQICKLLEMIKISSSSRSCYFICKVGLRIQNAKQFAVTKLYVRRGHSFPTIVDRNRL